MRILLSKESKLELLKILKKKNNATTLKELSKKMNLSFKTIQNWIYTEKTYIPDNIIPNGVVLKIIDKQENNWGSRKGGKIGGKKSFEMLVNKLGQEGYNKMMQQRRKKTINTLTKRYGIKELTRIAVEGKIRARKNKSEALEKRNESYFTNEEILLDLKHINYTPNDIKKRIIFPHKMTPELAEEIGAHLGDGCMSFNRNYFSIKTNKTEEEYMNYLFRLYKKIYNLDLKMMRLPSVVGFEVYSRALCEFKNKVLDLPYGEKIHRIEIPKTIIDTKNKEIYRALIRGLFDTDGCICIIKKNSKNYPIISLSIKSEKLILQVDEMLKRLGYLSFHNKSYIALNGVVMFKKWKEEIGSNNSKNFNKLNGRVV